MRPFLPTRARVAVLAAAAALACVVSSSAGASAGASVTGRPAAPGSDATGAQVASTSARPDTADAGRVVPRRDRRPAFTVAVVPDTQEEVFGSDRRFPGRTRWLAANRQRLDLRFVLHTGDVVNWGWLAPSQYAVAAAAMQNLTAAGIPYALAAGNHDTRAVGVGGSAYVDGEQCLARFAPAECDTRVLLRHTEEFDAAFPGARPGTPARRFEPGRNANSWTTFATGRRGHDRYRWMVLTLELWPRPEVVEWARQVVASHPRHTVLVQTHSYLNPDGSIYQGHDYGATSPQYLYDRLVSQFPNVAMVFSGHVGTAAHRIDTGVHGNRIVSFLGTFHSGTTNPVRLLRINPRRGVVSARFVAPATGETFFEHDVRVDGLSFAR